MQVTERVVNLVARHLGRDVSDIKMNHHFMDDLGCDSLDTVELVILVEETFNIEIPDLEAERLETVNQLVNFVKYKSHVERRKTEA